MAPDAAVTRQRIRDAARRLLNRHGLGGVTVRSIARVAGISHGNLCYHYPNVVAVVAALVDELADTSDAQVAAVDVTQPPLRLLAELQQRTFTLMVEYRFFFLEYVTIVRALPSLRRRLRALKQRREQQFLTFLDGLRAAGLVCAEAQTGADRALFAQYDLVADFWMSQAEILFGGPTPSAQQHYERLAFGLLVPHLTDEGMRQIQELWVR